MKNSEIFSRWLAAAGFALLLMTGCAQTSSFKRIEFAALPRPDPALRPYLEKGKRIGVVCWTDVPSSEKLDIEKVMARLSNAISRRLKIIPEATIVSQDEILWKMGEIHFDSTSAISQETRALLREKLELDLLVLIKLVELQTRITPMSPTPYGLVSSPGIDLSIGLEMNLVNLHTGEVWRQSGQQQNWQPVRLQVFGGNQAERQLLMALSRPIERFLDRLAPVPRRQVRYFDLGGN